MAAVQGQFTLPLLAFQHHVGQLYIDPASIQFAKGLGQSDLCIIEQGRLQRANGKPVNIVCKVFRPFVVQTPADFRELLLEASKLHRLQHPNITRFLGLGCFAHGSLAEVRESMFMVEEYVGERTLRKLISEQMRCRHKNIYDMRSALRWAGQIASALSALHEQQPPYVHNDVKADNVFLTDAPRFLDVEDAKLGDLKPHRHVYDHHPSTLSCHQQQQRLQSPKTPHASSLQQPRFTLERISNCSSSADGERRLSWSSAASSTAVEQGPPPPPARAAAAPGVPMHQREQPKQPAFKHAGPWVAAAASAEGDSWLSVCSTAAVVAEHDTAAAAAGEAADAAGAADAALCRAAAVPQGAQEDTTAQPGCVTRGRSLPVPIAARGSHTPRGSSCPTNWNPGMPGSRHAATDTAAAGSAGAAAAAAVATVAESPGFYSASSRCSLSSFSSASLNSSSSVGVADACSCPSSAPPNTCSLAAELTAADAAAAAAVAAAAAGASSAGAATAGEDGGNESSRGGVWWPNALRQRSEAGLVCLSDSASSTGGGAGDGRGKAGLDISLAADADAEDHSPTAADAAVKGGLGAAGVLSAHEQQQRGRRGGLAKGALATALANAHPSKQGEDSSVDRTSTSICSKSLPDVAPQGPALPQKQRLLLGGLLSYKRSKSSPLEDDGVSHPHLQLARSAPDVVHAADVDEEDVQHGALLMPLQLSEPTGLCSLQRTGSSGSGDDLSKAAAVRRMDGTGAVAAAAAAGCEDGSNRGGPKLLQHAHTMPASSGSAGSCVYYGWELLPSGAASPCGAVHSSMLDLFADVAGDDIITSRRYRDSCHYTLVPGSFVQQRSPLSVPAASTSRSSSSGWDANIPAGTISITSSGSSQIAASAGCKWTATTLLALQQQQQGGADAFERGPGIGKGFAPSVIESKQHGSNSAFEALTAIDCIAEEGSSIATDSCAPSCSASRESSAHGGPHFFSSDGLSSKGSMQNGPQSPYAQGLQSLVTAGSLSKALGLSLLRQRSSNSSIAARSSSGGLTGDDRLSSLGTCSSPPSSPKDGRGSPSGRDSSPQGSSSPCKQQLLHLLVTASGGSTSSPGVSLKEARQLGELPQCSPWQQQPNLQESCSVGMQCEASAGGLPGTVSAPAAVAAAPVSPPVKKVRFSLARPTGTTASRDFGLLYAAPELVRGERPTEKVDVFAFGVLLYELLSRRLIVSSVAEVCARNSSSKRGSRRKQQQQLHTAEPAGDADDSLDSSDGSCTPVESPPPEHQLLLTYAQLVAGGYRPPMLPHFPEPVRQLISKCWASEPHERPRMCEVLQELQAWPKNRLLMSALNVYVLALADMGYPGGAAKQPKCGCVIS